MGDATAMSGIGNPAPQGYGPVYTNSDKTEPLVARRGYMRRPLPSIRFARRNGAGWV